MGTFKPLQRKNQFTSIPPTPTYPSLQPPRSLASRPTSASEQAHPVTQAQLDHAARFGHSFERISLFPPASQDTDVEKASPPPSLSHIGSTQLPIQRKVKTMGGEWDPYYYDPVVDEENREHGVNIGLKFIPEDPVDATRIGLTQLVTSIKNGAVYALNNTIKERSIPQNEPGAGAHIDQYAEYGNPLYATGESSPGETLASTPLYDLGAHGDYGWHYRNSYGKLDRKNAILYDQAILEDHGNSSSQVFETAALAVAGNQEGMYYGSVRWGWSRNATGHFEKLPLAAASQQTPTATFIRAAKLWNASRTSEGQETIPLPIPSSQENIL
jgi:hypothetical protein